MARTQDIRGPGRPVADHGSNVKQALLVAARQKIIDVGFAAASTKDIAASAGVNPAMINYYFGSKAALGEAVMRDAVAPLIEHFERVATDIDIDSADVATALPNFVRAYMGAMAVRPWIPQLVVREVLPANGRFRELFLAEVAKRGAAVLPRLLLQAKGDDRHDSPEELMFAAVSIVSLAIFPFLAAPVIESVVAVKLDDPEVLERFVEHTVGIVTQGLSSWNLANQ